MSQTETYFFFPGSAHAGSVAKMLSTFDNRYKNTFIPNRNIWINRRYFDISNSRQKQCSTIDTCDVNALGPGKFRTQADSGTQQICYYNRNKTDINFNSFWQQESKHHKRVK